MSKQILWCDDRLRVLAHKEWFEVERRHMQGAWCFVGRIQRGGISAHANRDMQIAIYGILKHLTNEPKETK